MTISNVCVYCGSSNGNEPAYLEAGQEFGRILARSGVGLVYGGGGVGIMGAIARSVMAEGGRVTGIIPEFLCAKEVQLKEITEFIVTDSMHTRKWTMFERSDAFVALLGDDLAEVRRVFFAGAGPLARFAAIRSAATSRLTSLIGWLFGTVTLYSPSVM